MRARSVVRSSVVALVGIMLAGASLVGAQGTSPGQLGISVIGRGEASAPADTVTLQLTVAEPNYGPPSAPQPGVVPGERERTVVAPVVAALVAAGAPEDRIEVVVGPTIADFGTSFGLALALIEVVVDNPEREQLGDLVSAAAVAAADERLAVGRISAVYAVADCAPLEREARELAVADAQRQADVMAELIGVSRGEIVGTRDVSADAQSLFSPYGPVAPPSACGAEAPATTGYGAYVLPPFDPTAEPEVTAYATIELTLAMAGSPGATPAP